MTLYSAAQARDLADDLEATRARLVVLQSRTGQLSRLTAMERMAFNFIHELNQPLAALVNYLRAGQRLIADPQAPDIERLAVALDGALIQSLHASQIVGRVRAFVTRGETDKRVEPIAPIVQSAIALAMPDTEPHGITLSVALDPDARLVLVDRMQIRQVLVNLIRNAVEAMHDSPRRELSITSRSADGVVEITVADTGCGLAAEIRDHLFEPFMTTRSDGTGLGLTICNAIVAAHGGTLSYEPVRGGGSCFRFGVTGVADALP